MTYKELNHPGCSPSRLLDSKKNKMGSITTLTGDQDGIILTRKRTQARLSQICEPISETNVIHINDGGPIADPQIGSPSNKSSDEHSNDCINARVSRTSEKVRETSKCNNVNYRKKKRICHGTTTGHLKGQSATSQRSSRTTREDIADVDKCAPGKNESHINNASRRWCIKILRAANLLNENKLGGSSSPKQAITVGDGIMDQRCKICYHLEDRETLICDMCEESFHMSCLKSKVNLENLEEWYCPTCQIERNSQMLGENLEHKSRVKIGSEHQAEIPEYMGEPSDSVPSRLIGVVVSLEEMIDEKERSEANIKNDIWEKGWKPATSLPPGSKENWLQCMSIIYGKGDVCSDGEEAMTDIFCGKWRRAPLSEVQTQTWDCSCAVLWDPHHADCFVKQELETAEIKRRMKRRR